MEQWRDFTAPKICPRQAEKPAKGGPSTRGPSVACPAYSGAAQRLAGLVFGGLGPVFRGETAFCGASWPAPLDVLPGPLGLCAALGLVASRARFQPAPGRGRTPRRVPSPPGSSSGCRRPSRDPEIGSPLRTARRAQKKWIMNINRKLRSPRPTRAVGASPRGAAEDPAQIWHPNAR